MTELATTYSSGASARARASVAGLCLAELVREIPGARLREDAHGDVVVRGVHHDSRRVEPGDLFVARPGFRENGERFVGDAVARGAVAVLAGEGASTSNIPGIVVADVPRALAFAAAAVYGHPTFSLDVVGITGTNGKTTTAHLVSACIDACGGRSGVVGTLGTRFEQLELPSAFTSPEGDEIARIAATMRDRGATHLVMEVSSIALSAARADAVRFRTAAFTNLTQDHLDYHGTMDDYAEAKARLFVELGPGSAAVNVDDPFGVELAGRLAPSGRSSLALARFSVNRTDVEVFARSIDFTDAGIDLVAATPRGDVRVRSPMLGRHNASNLLAAIAIAWLLDLDVVHAAEALSRPVHVAGRLERCDTSGVDDIRVLVDYAHTPDALARVLDSVRALGGRRVLCVFGCGGERDPGKRPKMGEAVGRGADFAIVTNDNPRSEDPRSIAEAIVPGLESTATPFEVELDRAQAIERAILSAQPGDIVLVAGKGHEPYQIIGAQTSAFDDRVEARRALALRRDGRR
jgi:UDP-N-acetylmuramoyl-L-alanyl-D-glutamate--2,6-diaminopimelate ligase